MFKPVLHALVLVLAALAVVGAVKYLSENAPRKDSLTIDGARLPIAEFFAQAGERVGKLALDEASKDDALRRYARALIENEIKNRVMVGAPQSCLEDPKAYYEYYKAELRKHKISCPEFPEVERYLNNLRMEK